MLSVRQWRKSASSHSWFFGFSIKCFLLLLLLNVCARTLRFHLFSLFLWLRYYSNNNNSNNMKNVWIFALDQNCFLIAKIWKSQRKKKKRKKERKRSCSAQRKSLFLIWFCSRCFKLHTHSTVPDSCVRYYLHLSFFRLCVGAVCAEQRGVGRERCLFSWKWLIRKVQSISH